MLKPEITNFNRTLIRGHVFKARTHSVACKAVHMLGGEDAGTGCAGWDLTALTQDLVSTLSTQWPTYLVFTRSSLFGGHGFEIWVNRSYGKGLG